MCAPGGSNLAEDWGTSAGLSLITHRVVSQSPVLLNLENPNLKGLALDN